MTLPTLLPRDKPRLSTQLERLGAYYRRSPKTWATLAELARAIGASEAGASARLRDLRNKLGWTVEKRIRKSPGLFEYHAVPPGVPAQLDLIP